MPAPPLVHRSVALTSRARALVVAAVACLGCNELAGQGPALSKPSAAPVRLGARVPPTSEAEAAGPLEARIERGSAAYSELVRCDHPDIVFKDEERSGADRLMTSRLRSRLVLLSAKVRERWPRVRLRVTEAWDPEREHGRASLHYAGRAADVTTSDLDPSKLGMLARLAVDSGFDWVFYEDATHVHVSVRK